MVRFENVGNVLEVEELFEKCHLLYKANFVLALLQKYQSSLADDRNRFQAQLLLSPSNTHLSSHGRCNRMKKRRLWRNLSGDDVHLKVFSVTLRRVHVGY